MRKATRHLLYSAVGAALFSFLLAGAAHAADESFQPSLQIPVPTIQFSKAIQHDDTGYLAIPWISQYVKGIYDYGIRIAAFLAGFMFIVGGIYFLTSGSSARANEGRKKIIDAVVGLVLVIGSYALLQTINPNLVTFKFLTVPFVRPQDAQPPPIEKQKVIDASLKAPTAVGGGAAAEGVGGEGAAAAPASSGADKPGIGKGCGASGKYPNLPPPPPCSGADACSKRFCDNKNYSITGVPVCSGGKNGFSCPGLAGFDGFPNTIGEQVAQKGLAMIPASQICLKNRDCDATNYFSINTFGPKASQGMTNLMTGSRVFLPEAKEGLVKAGEAAKAEGYFIAIRDGFRNMQDMAQTWCARRAASGGKNSGGLATPGTSNHQFGVGVDVALYKYDAAKNRFYQVTATTSVCQQVETQQLLGPENLKILEKFMAAGGFKHMCQEVWHFDYSGVYGIDCTECEFPAQMRVREKHDCG